MVKPKDILDSGVPVTIPWLLKQVRILIIADSKCSWCQKSKELLSKIAQQCLLDESEMFVLYVDEYKDGKKLYQEAVRITGEETVPQIFIDETYLGGYSKLRMLHERRYVHELLLPNARNVKKRKRKKEDVLKEFSSLVNIDSPDTCPMCIAEEMQKMKLEEREAELKEIAKEYMLARSAVELARKQLNKHHNKHSHGKTKSFMSKFLP